MTEPVVVMAELEDHTTRLDTASKELYRLENEFEDVAAEYEDTTNDLLVALLSEYEDSEKRLPGEDVRNALVISRLRKEKPILFGNYRRLKAEIERGEKRCKRIEKGIMARQSILSYLKTEAMAVQ